MADISVAEEADEGKTEAAAGGPGFLKKTISRIWGSGSTNGAGYQEVNQTTAAGMVTITKETKAWYKSHFLKYLDMQNLGTKDYASIEEIV